MKSFLKVSTKSQYALRLLVYIASVDDRVVPLSEVSQNEDISYGYLEEIVSPLKEKGFLKSKPGRKGGYVMAKNPKDISISDIVCIFEGDIAPVKCLAGVKCKKEHNCKTKIVWKSLRDNVGKTLSSIKLSDIL